MTSMDEEYLDEIRFSVFSAHQYGEDLSESEWWGDDEADGNDLLLPSQNKRPFK